MSDETAGSALAAVAASWTMSSEDDGSVLDLDALTEQSG